MILTNDEQKAVDETKAILEKEIEFNTDTELMHINMDNALCELFRRLGLPELSDIFESVNKWYA